MVDGWMDREAMGGCTVVVRHHFGTLWTLPMMSLPMCDRESLFLAKGLAFRWTTQNSSERVIFLLEGLAFRWHTQNSTLYYLDNQ